MLLVWYGLLFVLAVVATSVVVRWFHVTERETLADKVLAVVYAVGIFCIWAFACHATLVIFESFAHGNTEFDHTLGELAEMNGVTPENERLPYDLANTVVVLYRYDCKDCHAVYDNMMAAFDGNDDVYFVSSRTEEGFALCELYDVEDVPTGIYIARDETGGHDTKKLLYKTSDDGETVFDEEAASRLLELQARES